MPDSDSIITPEKALDILREASEALSHASYCCIVGMRPREEAIRPPWDELRKLIEQLSPDRTFVEPEPKATLAIVEVVPEE